MLIELYDHQPSRLATTVIYTRHIDGQPAKCWTLEVKWDIYELKFSSQDIYAAEHTMGRLLSMTSI